MNPLDDVAWCRSFPAADASQQLAAMGVSPGQLATLVAMLQGVAYDLKSTLQREKAERQISKQSSELLDLLKQVEHNNGWRHVFDDEFREPIESVEVEPLLEALETLVKSSLQEANRLTDLRQYSLAPKAGRSPRIRFFYWIALMVFWKFLLGRELSVSVTDGTPDGPLIRFMEMMSAGMQEPTLRGKIHAFVVEHRATKRIDRMAMRYLSDLDWFAYRFRH